VDLRLPPGEIGTVVLDDGRHPPNFAAACRAQTGP
jgi:hypothetical protein